MTAPGAARAGGGNTAAARPAAQVVSGLARTGPEPETRATRHAQLGRRLDAIRTRLQELAQDHPATPGRRFPDGREAIAQRHAAISQTAADQALASSVNAFHRAAEAHDRLADLYDRSASGPGGADRHQQRVAFHRAAAAADRQRAGQAQSLVPGGEQPDHRGGGVNPCRKLAPLRRPPSGPAEVSQDSAGIVHHELEPGRRSGHRLGVRR